jgi:hypothetical protein
VIYAIGLFVAFATYLLAGASILPAFEDVTTFGWVLMLVCWADADARHRRLIPCYDFGLLVGVFFPASIIWYCVWSRGWRGLLMIVALTLLWWLPYAVAGLVWLALYGRA